MYIKLTDKLYIRTEDIEALERIDDFNTRVFTHHNKYTVSFPQETILQMIHSQEANDAEKVQDEKDKELMRSFLENTGTFAG